MGELVLQTVPPLREQLDELREFECRSVVLDLRGVTLTDVCALHLIVSCNVHARESGIEFAILDGPPAVRRVFEFTGLVDNLTFLDRSAENGDSARPTTGPLGWVADTTSPATVMPGEGRLAPVSEGVRG